ncbi:MAG: dihydrofolate reductase [Deltaproteobacteria bacterium]|nr:dihydrofolate reductase [Deltaproteobacteria bacterium]
MTFDVVVAADSAWGIGRANGLPWPRLAGDLQHFRKLTTATIDASLRNAIVMGRKTWESKEVGGKPLPRRLNIVVSRTEPALPEGVLGARSLDEALAVDRAHDRVENVFVVGGAQLYRDALAHPQLRYVYLTRVHGDYACEVRIPDLDAHGFFRVPWDGERDAEDNGVRYRIERLARP